MLGGITGDDAVETTDEDLERVAVIQQLTWAHLHSALVPHSTAWAGATRAFASLDRIGRVGRVESE